MAAYGCYLELMGLADSAAYRRLARGVLQAAHARRLLLGLNIPNKKPGEPLLEWCETLRHELPDINVCVHYSLKHQRSASNPVEAFADFCSKASSLGIARVLLVTGPRGPRLDAVQVLEQMQRRQFPLGSLKLGVAFNACLPTEAERIMEQQRLVRKLKTGIVQEVWLNCGDDVDLLDAGISFVRTTAESLNADLQNSIFGSVLLPNPAQLQQMNERPWNGVQFSPEYLGSLEGMMRCTQNVLKLYGEQGVQPIVESKVRNADDVSKLEYLLTSLQPPAASIPGRLSGESDEVRYTEDLASTDAALSVKSVSCRRWGPGKTRVQQWDSEIPVTVQVA